MGKRQAYGVRDQDESRDLLEWRYYQSLIIFSIFNSQSISYCTSLYIRLDIRKFSQA
jgi:hypothetical protein